MDQQSVTLRIQADTSSLEAGASKSASAVRDVGESGAAAGAAAGAGLRQLTDASTAAARALGEVLERARHLSAVSAQAAVQLQQMGASSRASGEATAQQLRAAGDAVESFVRQIQASQSALASSTAQIQAASARTDIALRQTTTTAAQLGSTTARAGEQAARGLDTAESSARGLGDRLQAVQRIAGTVLGVSIGANLVREIVGIADASTNMASKLRLVSESEADAISVRTALFDISQRTRQDLGATVELYSRLTRATAELGLSERQRLTITTAVNQAAIVSGANTVEASNAIVQLSQALASGVFRGDEFRSVSEQLPIILDVLSASLGKNRGELRAMADQGLLTAELVAGALLDSAADLDAQFQQMGLTISGASTQLVNSFRAWLGEGTAALGISSALATVISGLATVLSPLLDIVTLVGVAWGVRYVTGVVAAAAAARAKRIAAVELTAAELASATAAEAKSLALVRQTQALAAAGLGTAQLTAAETALAAAGTRTAAATTAATAATAANVGVMSRLGSGLLALVGGPIGAGVVAVGALAAGIYAWSGALDDANPRIDALIGRLQDASSEANATADALARAAAAPPPLQGAIDQVGANLALLAEARRELVGAQDALAELERANSRMVGRFGLEAEGIFEARARVAELEAQIERLTAGTGTLASVLAERFAPALDAAGDALVRMASAGDIGSTLIELAQGVMAVGNAASTIRSADVEAGALFEQISTGAEKAAKDLQTAGKSAAQIAQGLVDLALAKAEDAQWTDAQVDALRASGQAYVGNLQAIEKAKNAVRDAAAAKRDAAKEERDAIRLEAERVQALQRTQVQVERIQDMRARLAGPVAQAELEYARAYQATTAAILTGELPRERGIELLALLGDEYDRTLRVAREDERQRERNADIVARTLDELEREAAALRLSADEREIELLLLEAAARAREQYSIGMRDSIALTPQEVEAIRARAGALQDEIRSLQERHRQVEQISGSLADAFGDFAVDAISDFDNIGDAVDRLGDNIADTFKRAISQAISEMLRLKVIQPLINGLLSGVGNMFGSMFGAAAGQAAGSGIAAFMPTIAAAAGGLYGLTNRGPSTGSAGSLAAAGAYGYGAWAAGTTLYGAALGASAGAATGVAGAAASGALAGGAGAAAAIPVVGWVVAAIAAIDMITGGKVFGTRYRPESSTSALNIGAGGGDATLSLTEVRQRSLFRGRQWRTTSQEAGDEAEAAADALFDAIAGTMSDAARQLTIDVPPVIDAAIRTITEYDKKGKVTSTKIMVDAIGRSWEEATAEAAATRITAESIIATIDAALGTTVAAAGRAIGDDLVDAIIDRADAPRPGLTKDLATQGEASAIAERWRDVSADMLLEGAQFLLRAAVDIRAGVGLLRDEGGLTAITSIVEDLQQSGESLVATYTRIYAATALFEDATALMGVAIDGGREAFVRSAAAIADAAGGIDAATALWSNYFQTFYSDSERAALALQRAQADRAAQLTAIGLDANIAAAEFRRLFELALPSLTPEEVAQWLRAGAAISSAAAAQANYNEALDQADASARAAREAITGILGDLDTFAAGIDRAFVDLERAGLTGFERSMLEINDDLLGNVAQLLAWRRSLEEAGASAEELARVDAMLGRVHLLAAQQSAAAIEALTAAGRDLVARLYGTGDASSATAAAAQLGSTGAAAVEQVGTAIEDVIERWMRGIQGVRDWLDGQLLGDLTSLTPGLQYAEAQRQFDAAVAAAQAGDPAALEEATRLADVLLRMGRDRFAAGQQFTDLEAYIRAAMTGLLGVRPVGGNLGSGAQNNPGTGFQGPLQGAVTEFGAQAAANRLELAQELAEIVRRLMQGMQRSLEEVSAGLGLDLRDFVADLGVDLEALTATSSQSLGSIANLLGIELADLARSVGVDLGALADSQSLLNAALEREIAGLPEAQRDRLQPLLDAVEEAARTGGPDRVRDAISALEDETRRIGGAAAAALAPYLDGIDPVDPLLGIDSVLRGGFESSVAQLEAINAGIQALLAAQVPAPPDTTLPVDPDGPTAVYVPGGSKSVMVVQAPIIPPPVATGTAGGESVAVAVLDALLREIRALREEVVQLRGAVQTSGSAQVQATREAGQSTSSAIQDQTRAMRSGRNFVGSA